MSLEMMSTAMGLLFSILAVTVSLGALIVWIVVWHRRRVHEADSSPQGADGSHREGETGPCCRSLPRSVSKCQCARAPFCVV